LLGSDLSLSLFDERTVRSIEFWTRGPKEEALERGFLVLHAMADTKIGSENIIVRHYDLGISPKIKDVRSSHTTTQVAKVLNGELDAFFTKVAKPE
jgi:hypothetical protein